MRGGEEGVAELGQTFSGSHCAVPVGNWALSFLHTVHFSRHYHSFIATPLLGFRARICGEIFNWLVQKKKKHLLPNLRSTDGVLSGGDQGYSSAGSRCADGAMGRLIVPSQSAHRISKCNLIGRLEQTKESSDYAQQKQVRGRLGDLTAQ